MGGVSQDCRFPEKIYDLTFEDVEPQYRFINDALNCSKNETVPVSTDCAYTFNTTTLEKEYYQESRLFISNDYRVSNESTMERLVGYMTEEEKALQESFEVRHVESYLPYKKYFKLEPGELCYILVANTMISEWDDERNFANFTISSTATDERIEIHGMGRQSYYKISEPDMSDLDRLRLDKEYYMKPREWTYLMAMNNSTKQQEFMISFSDGNAGLSSVFIAMALAVGLIGMI